MHRFPLSRRAFLSLSGAAGAGALFPSLATACLPPPDPLKPLKDLAAGINAFAGDLHTRLAKDAKDNLFFSPFSIEAALAMTAAGAKGTTLEEMEKVLHLPKDPHPAFGMMFNHISPPAGKKRLYELTVANAIWAHKGYPWEKAFLGLTQKHYGAGLTEVDFGESEPARKRINEWVEKETKEKIKNLIAPGIITPLTRMVLANAIYFKGTWLYQFDKKLTTNAAAFTKEDGTKAEVPLMALTGTLNYGETWLGGRTGLNVQVLELPYAGKDLSMLVFLPEKGQGVDRLAARMSGPLFAKPELKPIEVKVSLPRFKAESEFSLKPVLTDMGMKAAFTSGDADFTGLSPKGKELFISHVLHKAFVDVNEEGTEAAAATAVVISRPSAPPEPKVFRADRPFVFAIRDNATGAALFVGRYTGPKA